MSAPALAPVPLPRTGFASWLHRRELFIDPGGFRVEAGLRAVAVAAAAVAASVALSLVAGWDPARPAVIAGMFTLFAAAVTAPGAAGLARFRGILALIPSIGMLAVGTLLPSSDAVMLPAVAIVAFLAVGIGAWGSRLGALGQFGFVAFYYAALMNLDAARFPSFAAAATIAVVVSMLAALLPPPERRTRVLATGVTAVTTRVDELLRPLIHGADGSLSPERAQRTADGDARALRAACTVLGGRLPLVGASPQHPRGLLPAEAETLRERLFDVELAWGHVASFASRVTTMDAGSRAAASELLRTARAALTDEHADLAVLPADSDAELHALRSALEHGVRTVHALRTTDVVDLAAAAEPRPIAAASAAGVAAAPSGPAAVRRAAQAGTSTGLALVGGYLLSPAHPLWAAMPAFQVLQNSSGETRLSAAQRVAATVLGSALGFGLAVLVAHLLWADLVLLTICVFAMAFVRGVSPTWQAFWQTALMSLMYDALGTLSLELVHTRVLETVVGAAVAVLVASILLPVRTGTQVRSAAAAVVSDLGDAVGRAFAAPRTRVADDSGGIAGTDNSGGDAGADAVASGVGSTASAFPAARIQAALGTVDALARPIRLDPGSLRPHGIEEQRTALWALARSARKLALALERHPHVSPALRDQLAREAASNVAVVVAALRGTPLPDPSPSDSLSTAVIPARTGSDAPANAAADADAARPSGGDRDETAVVRAAHAFDASIRACARAAENATRGVEHRPLP